MVDDTEGGNGSGEGLPPGASALLRAVAHAPHLSLETPSGAGEPSAKGFAGTERFRVEAELGSGAFGTVYRVFDKERGLELALKVARRREPRWLLRFKEEFRSLAGIVHPNLVTLYDLGQAEGQIFLTMELVEGRDFLSYILDANPEEERYQRLRPALAQLYRGISYLHASGLVHRDLKPSNVLVTPDGRVVILDFGLISPGGIAGEVVGTPAYMSPEQVAGEASEASDWYAVGVMLYEVLTGALPFSGPSEEVLARKVEVEPPPARAVDASVPADLDEIAEGLLRKEPAERDPARRRLAALAHAEAPAPAAAVLPTGLPSYFVGRQAELQTLSDAFAASRDGCAWAFVQGGSGLGKSTLVSHFLSDIAARIPQALVLSSRCYERESVPYKALDGVVDALARWLRAQPAQERARLWPVGAGALAALFPSLAPGAADLDSAESSGTPRERLIAATRSLAELLTNICAERPVLMSMDDVQWGDRDSADLLCAVLATAEHHNLLVVTTTRPASDNPALDALVEHRARLGAGVRLFDLTLGPLAPEEAHDLAVRLIGEDDPRAATFAHQSDGNPFLLGALSRLPRDRVGDEAISLDQALQSDLDRLPAQARRIAEVVAVAGQPLQHQLAAEVAELPFLEPKAVVHLRSARILSIRVGGAGEALECYHDRVREALVESLSSLERQSCHRRLGEVLAGAGADPERVGEHYREGGQPRKAARYFEEAAERASQALAFARCARLLDLVATLDERPPAELSRLRERQAEAAENAGRAPEAMRAYEEAASHAQGERASALRALAAEQRWRGGQLADRTAAMSEALRTVGVRWPRSRAGVTVRLLRRRVQLGLRRFKPRPPPPAAERDDLLSRVDTTYFFAGFSLLAAPLEGLALHSESLHWALRAGDAPRLGRGLAIEGAVRAMIGKRIAFADELLRRGAAMAESGDVHCRAQVLAGRTWFHLARTSFAAADETAREAGRLYLSEPGTRFLSEVALMRFFRMTALYHLGRYAELQSLYAQHQADCAERDDLLWQYVGTAHFGWIASFLAGDSAGAYAVADEVASLEERVGVSFAHASSRGARAWAGRIAGDGRAAVQDMDRVWKEMRRQRLLFAPMFELRTRIDRASALLCAGAQSDTSDRARGAALGRAAKEAARARRLPLPAAPAAALLIRSAVEGGNRRPRECLPLLEEAETALAELGLWGWSMAARHRRGLLSGDEALCSSAEAFFRAQGARDPARVAEILLPWPAGDASA